MKETAACNDRKQDKMSRNVAVAPDGVEPRAVSFSSFLLLFLGLFLFHFSFGCHLFGPVCVSPLGGGSCRAVCVLRGGCGGCGGPGNVGGRARHPGDTLMAPNCSNKIAPTRPTEETERVVNQRIVPPFFLSSNVSIRLEFSRHFHLLSLNFELMIDSVL
jgi:hypothetical protein